jgi:hypothetical protein
MPNPKGAYRPLPLSGMPVFGMPVSDRQGLPVSHRQIRAGILPAVQWKRLWKRHLDACQSTPQPTKGGTYELSRCQSKTMVIRTIQLPPKPSEPASARAAPANSPP